MEEVVIKHVLDAVHFTLKNQRQYLDPIKMEKADSLIVPYIEENFEYSEGEFAVKYPGRVILAGDKRIVPIVIRYYAIMQDNLSLLKRLEDEKYNFSGNQNSINYFVLDKQLSSKFKTNEYIRDLKKYGVVFEHFYSTLRGLDYREREKILVDFADIVKKRPNLMQVGTKGHDYPNLLTRRNIDLFGKDFLLSLDDKQIRLVNSFYFQITEDNINEIKELVIKYPNFSMPIPLYREILDYFTVDELGNMSVKDMRLYEIATKNHLIDRMKELLSKNPEFDCPDNFIRYEIFRVIDNETILSLSNEVMEELSKVRLVELNNVYVFPVKKINRIIMKDKLKKKIEGIHKK